MGRLVEDVTRLVGEIQALRGSRRALLKELSDDNLDMCAHFAGRRMQVATRMKEGRLAFLHNLRRTVRGQLRGMRADMAGARRAWSGEAA
jgi:hypothetical protein